jgi:hypothetical protein
MDPAIHSQDSEKLFMATAIDARQRALFLLGELQALQASLPRSSALAWERAAFAEVFLDSAPRRQIQSFLQRP